MNLIIFTPSGKILQENVKKVTVETLGGYYTLLPKHVDFVSAMKSNIVTYADESGAEKYAACHRGIVVKKADTVTISVQNAVLGDTLDELTQVVQYEFRENEEKRKEFNTAMARLELGLIKGFGKMGIGESNDGI